MKRRKVEMRVRLSTQGVDWYVYGSMDNNEKWVQCDVCGAWWDLKSACVNEENVAETRFTCDNC